MTGRELPEWVASLASEGVHPGAYPTTCRGDECSLAAADAEPRAAVLTTCIETINGDPNTALRLSFQIKVF